MKLKPKRITERGAVTAMTVSKHVLNLSEDLTCQSLFVELVRLQYEHNVCKSSHKCLPLPLAVVQYKDHLKLSLDSMANEKKNQSELKQQQRTKISELEELTGSLEKDISAQFDKIHQYLHYKEKCLIEELRRQKEQDLQPMDENLKRIEEELASLEEKISKLCVDIDQQNSVSFLKELKRLKERYLDIGENGEGAEREDMEILMVPRQKCTGI
ncbi:hypothetical protein scyTo_0010878 [Scyliorhinus torazame]|uniref:Uncharacterized protein n=1 Tax=Scyliorhinus torazame TaxID=75743 RepID=A0A401PCQ9_SCYTO|nr:hypothetical protein [Scyliorhinus torazame]